MQFMETSFDTSLQIAVARLKPLRQKSDARGWMQTLSHIGAILICSFILLRTWGSWWAVPAFMVQGLLINCLYAAVHELSHDTVFKTRRLNEIFGRLFTFVLLMGRDQDKFEHFQHHRHTQDIERDAEIIGGVPFTLWTYFLYFSGLSYWPGRIGEVLRLACGQTHLWPYLSPPQMRRVHMEARIMLILYVALVVVSVLAQSWILLQLWVAPMLCMKWFQMMQNMAEHTAMPHEPDILVNTRTIKANGLMKWLLWNMPYHMAHHTYPMIPFHKLPELHAEIVEGLGYEPPSISHLAFQKHFIRKLIKEGTSRYAGQDVTAY